jgi:hypothetical protein
MFYLFYSFNVLSSVFLSPSSRFSLYEISVLTFDIILTFFVTIWLQLAHIPARCFIILGILSGLYEWQFYSLCKISKRSNGQDPWSARCNSAWSTSILGLYTFVSTSFSNTCYLCSFLTILYHTSHPHRMTEISVLGVRVHTTRIWRFLKADGVGTSLLLNHDIYLKGKAIPLQAWTGAGFSRRMRLPDFKTIGTWKW